MGTVVAVYRQAPRPANADPEEQEAFKKAPRTAEGGVGGSPGGRGGVVAEDEMCVGLKPVLRRAWAPKGRRRYEWVYVYGFVRPRIGEAFWLLMPTVNAEAFSLVLGRFAKWVGPGQDKRVLLVVGRAGWRVAGDLRIPEGLDLKFLPARSPELQPVERLRPLVNERIANRPSGTSANWRWRWWRDAWRSPSVSTCGGGTAAAAGGRTPHEASDAVCRKPYK